MTEYEKTLENDPHHIEAQLCIILVLIDTTDYEEANRRFTNLQSQHQGVTSNAKKIAGHYKAIANLYHIEGKQQLALQTYTKSLEFWPHDNDCRKSLARIFIQQKKYQKALEQLQNIIQTSPKDDEAISLLGLVKYLQGQKQAAERHWMQARRMNISNASAKTFLHVFQSKHHQSN